MTDWRLVCEALDIPPSTTSFEQLKFWELRGDSQVDIAMRMYCETLTIPGQYWGQTSLVITLRSELIAALSGCKSAQYFLKTLKSVFPLARPKPTYSCEHCGSFCRKT